jgi:uncharacterized protein YjlB
MDKAVATIQVDNERTRVAEWRFYHRHEFDYVVVPQTTGKLKLVGPDGGETIAALTAGQSYFREAGVEHDVINASDHEFVFVEIEFK